MIKLVQNLKRHPELSVTKFRERLNDYGFLVKDVADELGAARVAVSTTLAVEHNTRMRASRGTSDPPDAIVEIWMRKAPNFDDPSSDYLRELLDDMREMQETFIDVHASSFFFALERVENGREAAAALSQRLMRIDQLNLAHDLTEM